MWVNRLGVFRVGFVTVSLYHLRHSPVSFYPTERRVGLISEQKNSFLPGDLNRRPRDPQSRALSTALLSLFGEFTKTLWIETIFSESIRTSKTRKCNILHSQLQKKCPFFARKGFFRIFKIFAISRYCIWFYSRIIHFMFFFMKVIEETK